MSSFSCPHIVQYACSRLKTECVPGRAGCVLRGKVLFLVPAEERVRQLAEQKSGKSPKGTNPSSAPRFDQDG